MKVDMTLHSLHMSEISCLTLPGHVLDASSMIQYVSHVLATGRCRGIHVVLLTKLSKSQLRITSRPVVSMAATPEVCRKEMV